MNSIVEWLRNTVGTTPLRAHAHFRPFPSRLPQVNTIRISRPVDSTPTKRWHPLSTTHSRTILRTMTGTLAEVLRGRLRLALNLSAMDDSKTPNSK